MRQRCGSTPPAPEGHQNVATGECSSRYRRTERNPWKPIASPGAPELAGVPSRFSDASVTRLFPDLTTKALLAFAASTSLLAGCHSQVGWDARQVRSPTAEDSARGWGGFDVLEILHTYPIDFNGLYAGSWPSPGLAAKIGGEYEPLCFGPIQLTNSEVHWAGPSVFVADLKYVPSGSWSPTPHMTTRPIRTLSGSNSRTTCFSAAGATRRVRTSSSCRKPPRLRKANEQECPGRLQTEL